MYPPAHDKRPWQAGLRHYTPSLLLSSSTIARRLQILFGSLLCLFIVFYLSHSSDSGPVVAPSSLWNSNTPRPQDTEPHPIDDLIEASEEAFRKIWNSHGKGIAGAAAKYREKRGRHPPPGFDAWYRFAAKKKAVVAEDIFDQIYHDLEPFWSITPKRLRDQTASWPFIISIRDHKAHVRANNGNFATWPDLWRGMMDEFLEDLPDMDLAVNIWDEPRVYVPWEDMNKHFSDAIKTRHTDPGTTAQPIVTTFPQYEPLSFEENDIPTEWPRQFKQDTQLWDLTRAACPSNSPARSYPKPESYEDIPQFPFPRGSHYGYIQNWTLATSLCDNPEIGRLHGGIMAPRDISASTKLFPVFSGCKAQSVNNDIVLPGAMYYSTGEYSGFANGKKPSDGARVDSVPWNRKKAKVVWRGQATGGESNATNWRHLQRHRFISMLNGTQVRLSERALDSPDQNEIALSSQNFPIPNNTEYPISALMSNPSTLGPWIAPFSDGLFTHLMCTPSYLSQFTKGKDCSYLNPYYRAGSFISIHKQFNNKFLPDIDGYSYSARFRSFLRSNSLPIKATIYVEWHTARLTPWKHFVPLDNSFIDWWGIIDYFVGYDDRAVRKTVDPPTTVGPRKYGHDAVAERIASEGRDWAEKAIRREDMLVYMYRLLLEWARIYSDDRLYMGYVHDILNVPENTFD